MTAIPNFLTLVALTEKNRAGESCEVWVTVEVAAPQVIHWPQEGYGEYWIGQKACTFLRTNDRCDEVVSERVALQDLTRRPNATVTRTHEVILPPSTTTGTAAVGVGSSRLEWSASRPEKLGVRVANTTTLTGAPNVTIYSDSLQVMAYPDQPADGLPQCMAGTSDYPVGAFTRGAHNGEGVVELVPDPQGGDFEVQGLSAVGGLVMAAAVAAVQNPNSNDIELERVKSEELKRMLQQAQKDRREHTSAQLPLLLVAEKG